MHDSDEQLVARFRLRARCQGRAFRTSHPPCWSWAVGRSADVWMSGSLKNRINLARHAQSFFFSIVRSIGVYNRFISFHLCAKPVYHKIYAKARVKRAKHFCLLCEGWGRTGGAFWLFLEGSFKNISACVHATYEMQAFTHKMQHKHDTNQTGYTYIHLVNRATYSTCASDSTVCTCC